MLGLDLTGPRHHPGHRERLLEKGMLALPWVRGIHRHQIPLLSLFAGVPVPGKKEQQTVLRIIPVLVDKAFNGPAQFLCIRVRGQFHHETGFFQDVFHGLHLVGHTRQTGPAALIPRRPNQQGIAPLVQAHILPLPVLDDHLNPLGWGGPGRET